MQCRSSCRDVFMERANSLNSHLPIINACSLLHVALSSFCFHSLSIISASYKVIFKPIPFHTLPKQHSQDALSNRNLRTLTASQSANQCT